MPDTSLQLLTELDPVAKVQWYKQIQVHRSQLIHEPTYFVDEALRDELVFNRQDVSAYIRTLRAYVWESYLKEELLFHKEMLSLLISDNRDAYMVLARAIGEHYCLSAHAR